MYEYIVQIVRFVDADQPGWVECELVDANGRHHIIREKVPVLTAERLDANSEYPIPCGILCEVLERYNDEKGHELALITTKKPWWIESVEGLTEFVVPAALVTLSTWSPQ